MAITKEEKQEKFKELAVPRVTAAIKKIRLIANLGNKNSYLCTPQQIEKIETILTNEIDNAVMCLKSGTTDESIFDL